MATISGFVPHNRPAKPRKSKIPKQVVSPAADAETAAAVEPKDEVAAPGSCSLARLPGEIRRMIFSSLDYHSLIRLSTTSQFFHRTVVPQTLADPLEMLQFVGRAMNFPSTGPRREVQMPTPETSSAISASGSDHQTFSTRTRPSMQS
uniref:F-box domain-containing protein n=1 Tax=Bionectria ochroleuca TaxID=29856 RepID=A0A8H7N7C9_BIOOC